MQNKNYPSIQPLSRPIGNFTRIFLKRGEEREIKMSFPWVYDNEVSHVKYFANDGSIHDSTSGALTGRGTVSAMPLAECPDEDGSGVEVYAASGAFLGTGIINRASRMIVRFISHDRAEKVFADTKGFWQARILDAANIRRLHYSDSDSYRLVFAEADFVPGLIVDRFVDISGQKRRVVLVVQFLSLAVEVFRAEIINALVKATECDGIYERDDTDIRDKEGLEQRTGWIWFNKSLRSTHQSKDGGDTLLVIKENGIEMEVDIANGQKTGYFLDQKLNRAATAALCRGKRVLDAFCHTGGFALAAAKAGAKEVIAADIDQNCVEAVGRNARRNKLEGVVKAECTDVFDLLKKYEEAGEKFDVIILDPPAFTKSAKTINKAYSGYKEINLRAMRLVRPSAALVTCSCSYFFDSATFYDMLTHAAADSHRAVQVLEKRGAGPDHPVLLGHSRSEYLKCAIVRVM